MEDKESLMELKAELLSSGTLFVPKEMRLPFPTSKSSAGPGAGTESIVVVFSNLRAKLPISHEGGELALIDMGKGNYSISKDGKTIVKGVTLLPTLCHAPGQAFVSLGRTCKMKCAFCTMNEAAAKLDIAVDEALDIILAASEREGFTSVAITSGVQTTVDDQVNRMAQLVSAVRSKLPSVPIGVEPIIEKKEQIAKLKKAGATEIKINLEAATNEIFEKACPNRDCETTIKMVHEAVHEFGKGAVTSNIIIGLGETDQQVRDALDMLAGMGCAGNLRALRINSLNADRLRIALGKLEPVSKERMMKLAKVHATILTEHGLSTKTFKTMCFPCSCCDLVPGVDF
jgi:biotin synthase-related radical SAM superfamily protein